MQGSLGGAPEVVYAYTAPADMAVDISTCGSLFDTQLYIIDDPENMQVGGRGYRWAHQQRTNMQLTTKHLVPFVAAIAVLWPTIRPMCLPAGICGQRRRPQLLLQP